MSKEQDDTAAAMAEAHKRGLLPPDMKDAYEEAMRRGLVAGGESLAPVQKPQTEAQHRAFVADIDSAIDEAANMIPGGYEAWNNAQNNPKAKAFQPVIDQQDNGIYFPGIGKSSQKPAKKATPPLLARPNIDYEGQRKEEQRKKELAAMNAATPAYSFADVPGEEMPKLNTDFEGSGEMLSRVPGSAMNSFLGGLDFLSQPGRWVDDALHMPSLVFDWDAIGKGDLGKGLQFKGYDDLTDEERGYTGLPRIAMSEADTPAKQFGDFLGEGAGALAPGSVVHKGAERVGQIASKIPGIADLVAAITPKGSDIAARVGRYGQRMASSVPEAAAQAGVFGGSTADRYEIGENGEVVNVGENPFKRAAEFMTNPLTYTLVPLASMGRRVAEGIISGGKSITPPKIQAEVAPHMLSNSDRAVAALGDIPVPAGIGRKDADTALKILHKTLSSGGVPDDVMQAVVERYAAAGPDRPAFAVFARSELGAYPKAIENLDNALYEIGQKAPEVGKAITQIRTTQGARLKDGLAEDMGGQDRLAREKGLETKKGRIGEGYEEVLDLGPIDDESADNLRALLSDRTFQDQIPLWYRKKLELEGIDNSVSPPDMLGGAGTRAKVTLEQRIQDNPLEVAHWLYSNLGKKIHGGKDPTGALQEIQDALRPYLDKAGGRPYTELRDDYAARSEDIEALNIADRMNKVAASGYNVKVMRDVYRTATKTEKTSMRIGWREWIEDQFRKAKLSQDFLPLQKLEQEGVLDALKTILGDGEDALGTKVVDRIKQAVSEQATVKAVDPQNTTGKTERLASGREAYAGKTGSLEYRDKYDLTKAGQDAVASLVLKAPIPPRLIFRMVQKIASRLVTPSKGGRTAAARLALETTPGAPKVNPRVEAARARARRAARVNGKFAQVLDPEMPGRPPFDEEGFARSMSDDGTPKVDGGGGAVAIPDDEYPVRPRPKRLSGDQRALPPPKGEDKKTAAKEMTPAQKYLEEIRQKKAKIDEELNAKAAERDTARGDRRQAERYASDAEAERAQADALAARTRSEDLKIEREKAKQLAAEERARRAAQGADDEPVEAPVPPDGPFGKYGRLREKQTAPAGDPRAVGDAMRYIVGKEEPAALQANLRRFARDGQPESYTMDSFKRITDILAALKGETKGVAPEALAAVKGMNKANREWLIEELSDPSSTDIIGIMPKIDALPKIGPVEMRYKAAGPLAAGTAGMMAAAVTANAAWNNRDKRTRAQIEADRKILDREGKWDDITPDRPGAEYLLKKYGTKGFEAPGDSEVRKMQAALNALGYHDNYGNKLTVDGKIGEKFTQSILTFAEANGLTVNGQNPGSLTDNIVTKLREYYQ